MRFALLSLLALFVSGCAGDMPFRVEHGWTEERVLRDTWLPPRQVVGEQSYCYRTLAWSDCYKRPQPREATRLVGYIGPEPF